MHAKRKIPLLNEAEKKLLGRVEYIQLNEMRARLSALFARWRNVMRKLLFQRKRERERERHTRWMNAETPCVTRLLRVYLKCSTACWILFEFRKDPLNVD